MPIIRVNSATLYYEEHGTGPEIIVFAHGLLWSCRMFDEQVAALKDRYRCITFDFRGQGQSEVTRDGYDMETLYEDAAALIEALHCAPRTCRNTGSSLLLPAGSASASLSTASCLSCSARNFLPILREQHSAANGGSA